MLWAFRMAATDLDQLKRREFITLLGGAAMEWPRAAVAQQPTMPVIGFLSPASPDANVVDRLRGFRQGLKDTGHVDGENVTIMYRWAEGQFDRLPPMSNRPLANAFHLS
jgi:putative tryptophan/tyrosine transport system substrate-binding protein